MIKIATMTVSMVCLQFYCNDNQGYYTCIILLAFLWTDDVRSSVFFTHVIMVFFNQAIKLILNGRGIDLAKYSNLYCIRERTDHFLTKLMFKTIHGFMCNLPLIALSWILCKWPRGSDMGLYHPTHLRFFAICPLLYDVMIISLLLKF